MNVARTSLSLTALLLAIGPIDAQRQPRRAGPQAKTAAAGKSAPFTAEDYQSFAASKGLKFASLPAPVTLTTSSPVAPNAHLVLMAGMWDSAGSIGMVKMSRLIVDVTPSRHPTIVTFSGSFVASYPCQAVAFKTTSKGLRRVGSGTGRISGSLKPFAFLAPEGTDAVQFNINCGPGGPQGGYTTGVGQVTVTEVR